MEEREEKPEIGPKRPKISSFGNPGKAQKDKIGHEEIYNLLTGDEIGWQAIIYDLARSEQLDPLNIDITLLTRGFLEKMRKLEEANFFVSGKVLLAAAILLRMKAERVYDQLQHFDELLFGREEQEETEAERFYVSRGELPIILPKTPLPRMKKVTIEELMKALNRAIEVEERRQKRYDSVIEAEREAAIVLPRKTINITEKIKELYKKIKGFFFKQIGKRMTFSELVPSQSREDKIATFIPLLHLDSREKIILEQPKAFEEIYIYLFNKKGQEE